MFDDFKTPIDEVITTLSTSTDVPSLKDKLTLLPW